MSEAAIHQLFKGHAADLPELALLGVHIQAALTRVVKGQGHFEHRLALIIPDENRIVGESETYRFLQFLGFQANGKFAGIVSHEKFVSSRVGTQRIPRLDVVFNFESEGVEHFRKSARGTLSHPVEA